MSQDKIAHLLAGMAIAAALSPFGIFPAIVVTVFAAIGKEAWDSTGRGTVEVMDAVATLAGGALMLSWFQLAHMVV